MIKKYILGALVALSIPAMIAYAATPFLTVSGNGDSSVTVTVTGGEPNAPVVLYYNQIVGGTVQSTTIGTTDQNGRWSGNVNTNTLGIVGNTPVYVQVGGYQSQTVNWPQSGSSSGTVSITFSQSSPNIALGQNSTVTLSGGNGSYYISSNSNASGIVSSITGNTLTLYGSAAGQANIVVCSTGGGCGTIMVTAGSGSSTGTTNAPTVSQSSLNVNAGGQGTIALSGGTGPYTVSIPAGSGISTTLVGNTLYVNASTTVAAGLNAIQVCSANNGGCTSVSVNVQAQGSTQTNTNTNTNTNTGTGMIGFTLPLTMGQALQLNLSGGNGTGGYYIQSPVSSLALASISGNSLMLNGTVLGSGTVTVCQTGGTTCLPITFTVNPAPASPVLSGTGGGYLFDADLSLGVTGSAVIELQNRLKAEGYFNGAATGYFGPLTMQAVRNYQRAHGISSTGYVGSLTRAELNR